MAAWFFNWLYSPDNRAVSLKSFWTWFTSYFGKVATEGPSVQLAVTVAKCSRAVTDLVEIAPGIFCRCSQADLCLDFWPLTLKQQEPKGCTRRSELWAQQRAGAGLWALRAPTQLPWVGCRVTEVGMCSPWLCFPTPFLSTEVRRECCWSGSHHYLKLCMGIEGRKRRKWYSKHCLIQWFVS